MQGIAAYDSDEEEPAPPAATAAAPAAADEEAGTGPPAAKKPKLDSPASGEAPKPVGKISGGEAPKAAPAPAAKAAAATTGGGKKARLPPNRLKEVRKEIRDAKSATAVVQVVRKHIKEQWDSRWGAEALQQISKRSTARTRREWAVEASVKDLSQRLQDEATGALRKEARREGDVETLLLSLEGLRRMSMQEPEAQKDILDRILVWMVADKWQHPVKSLARLYWLGGTLKLRDSSTEFASSLPAELRRRATELDGPDVALLLAAMRRKGGKDTSLLEKVVVRLRSEGVHEGLSATDLVEAAEGLAELGASDETALRPLGQEALRRRGELTPDESHRIHTAYQTMKLPLPKVWAEPGETKKKDAGGQLVTTQAFVPQEGHRKFRHGNHDVQKTSPPRVVRDYKMMSY